MDMILVPEPARIVRVEIIVRGCSGAPSDIPIHSTVIVPVVDKREDQSQAKAVGYVHDVVETPEDVLVINTGARLQGVSLVVTVVEGPCANDLQTHLRSL